MRAISQFLSRYRFEPTEALLRRAVVDAVFEECGIHISERSVSVRGDTAHLSLRPIERSEVFQHYQGVLTRLQSSSNGKKITRLA